MRVPFMSKKWLNFNMGNIFWVNILKSDTHTHTCIHAKVFFLNKRQDKWFVGVQIVQRTYFSFQ